MTRRKGSAGTTHTLDGSRGTMIGAHPQRIGVFYLEQVRNLYEYCGDISVVNRHNGNWNSDGFKEQRFSAAGTVDL